MRSSIEIETMYLPGTIAKPNTRGSSTTFSKQLIDVNIRCKV